MLKHSSDSRISPRPRPQEASLDAVEREERITIRSPANENGARSATQHKRARRATGNQQCILKNNLNQQPAAACLKRQTHTELMRARMEPRKLKVGEIQTAHQKDGS